MDSIERDGQQLLAPLRDDAPDQSTVDINKAVRTGTRRVRVRQAVVAGVAAVVTGLAAVAVPAIVAHPRTTEPARPAAELSVLSQQFTVGSAGGFTPISYETGRFQHRVELGPASGDAPDRASVTMYPRGRSPWNLGGEQAADVNGRKAFWLPSPVTDQAAGTEIAWEWSDGGWAFAYVHSTRPDARDLAHRVAESVAAGPDNPVAVPFTVAVGSLELLGVITPFGTSSDRTSGALLVLSSGTDRILVGVQRDLTLDLATGQRRAAPEVSIPDVGGGYSVLAQADRPGAPLQELAAAVRVLPDGSLTFDPLR